VGEDTAAAAVTGSRCFFCRHLVTEVPDGRPTDPCRLDLMIPEYGAGFVTKSRHCFLDSTGRYRTRAAALVELERARQVVRGTAG
jgi:hypothetical protein